MDKIALVAQLADRLRASLETARREAEAAAEEARDGATPNERREDSRTALEFSRLARSQSERARRMHSDLLQLDGFRPGPLPPGAAIGPGSVVEIEHESDGGRTVFLAPVGAGEELTGPGGDGFLSVVTPASPIGRALLGRRSGETIEVRIGGALHEWTITFAE